MRTANVNDIRAFLDRLLDRSCQVELRDAPAGRVLKHRYDQPSTGRCDPMHRPTWLTKDNARDVSAMSGHRSAADGVRHQTVRAAELGSLEATMTLIDRAVKNGDADFRITQCLSPEGTQSFDCAERCLGPHGQPPG